MLDAMGSHEHFPSLPVRGSVSIGQVALRREEPTPAIPFLWISCNASQSSSFNEPCNWWKRAQSGQMKSSRWGELSGKHQESCGFGGIGCHCLSIGLIHLLSQTEPRSLAAGSTCLTGECTAVSSCSLSPGFVWSGSKQFQSLCLKPTGRSETGTAQNFWLKLQFRNWNGVEWKCFFRLMEVLPTYFFPYMKVIKCSCAKC